MSYSQNDEEQIIVKYFGDFVGNLVDIGCNDGHTFSNSARLIELGWSGKLFDANKDAAEKAKEWYADNPKVEVFNYGIGNKERESKFYTCKDTLLSSIHKKTIEGWGHLFEFTKTTCDLKEYDNTIEADFITIDAEYMDWEILQTIDLSDVRCVCVEAHHYPAEIKKYCEDFGMMLLHKNYENSIFVR